MALRKSISVSGAAFVQTDIGIINTGVTEVSFDAYIKVDKVSATKTDAVADVIIFGDGKSQMKTYRFTPSMDAGNFIKQTYEHLKTLPEFANAEDC